MTSGVFFLILLALGIIVALFWRLASRRCAIPCPVWMSGLLDAPFTQGISARTQKTIQRLDLRQGMNVLDAGCGPGRVTIPVALATGPRGHVTGMDIQDGMLGMARERARKANLTNILFLNAGLGAGMLEDNFYDRALMVTVLGEIPDREAALQEIYRALRPGGLLLVEETIRDPHFQTRGTVIRLAGAVGFVKKDFFGTRFSYTMTLVKPAAA
jgi:ubiquinone/menaquinone biosynthesis C-methylase UbiE